MVTRVRSWEFTILRGLMFAIVAGLSCELVLADAAVKLGPPLKPADDELMVPVWGIDNARQAGRKLSFVSLPLKMGGSKVQLSGGTVVVDLLDWQSVAISDNEEGNMCSLTLVGPRAVLLAAHCLDAGLAPGQKGTPVLAAEVSFVATGGSYEMKCDINPDYLRWAVNAVGVPRSAGDYALCELDRPVKDIDYETISLEEDLQVNAVVTLVGYGCVSLGISEDETRYTYKDGSRILRIGERPINAIAVSLFAQRPAQYWRTLSTSDREPAVCYGDSGGPVMYPKIGGSRRVIAVNSALGAAPTATHLQPDFYSYLSPLNTREFKIFVRSWVGKGEGGNPAHPRVVCGFNRPGGLQGCRN